MFMKIMAAIDGGNTSMTALTEAMRIATSQQATLCIVYAASDSDRDDQLAGINLLERAVPIERGGIKVETRLLRAEAEYGLNGVVEAIATAADEWGADLVVVGTANRRGLERFVIGSVAEQLIPKVDASILMVRPHRSPDS